MPNLARRERLLLVDLLEGVGPDAPTLCEGWTAADLAAHLVVREHRPDAAVGLVVPMLAAYSERIRRSTRDRTPWAELVGQVRAGPPLPLRAVDEAFNTLEYFVHHEDVRRARPAWAPRRLDPGLESRLWARLRAGARLLLRRSPTGVDVEAIGHGVATLKVGSPVVTLRGTPGELTLVVFGRGHHADVDYQGDDAAIERFRGARLGL
jgi:uncharacterized protein (TIGR03085 family)